MFSMEQSDSKPTTLVVLWTRSDREVALKMVFMYAFNALKYNWWPAVTLIVWGPSSKLLVEDQELQDHLSSLREAGVKLEACKACSDMYEVSDQLIALGVHVRYMGEPITDYLKNPQYRVITI